MLIAEFRSDSNMNMEGIQRNSFLNHDDEELVETQHLTSETTTVVVPGQNCLQDSTYDQYTGKFRSSLNIFLHNTNTNKHLNLTSFFLTYR